MNNDFPHELLKNASFHECNLLSYLSNSTCVISTVKKWRKQYEFFCQSQRYELS